MKKTPWFSEHVKPARIGVYERKGGWGITDFSYWDGRRWSVQRTTPGQAYEDRNDMSPFQCDQWRGLILKI